MPQYFNPDTGKPVDTPQPQGGGKQYYDPDSGQPIAAPAPQGTMSAAPPEPWLNQVEDDLREGGNKTLPGRVLGYMQGRGDKGYSGMQSGVSPQTADLMGSPAFGTIHALQGEDETVHGHPLAGGWKTVKGIAEAATLPSMVMGGPEAKGLMEAIPTRAHASSVFADIENQAKDVPVSMENTNPALQKFSKYVSTGGSKAPVITKLAKRVEAPEPVNFPEARDFYTNVSRLTKRPGFIRRAIESPMKPSMRYEAGGVRQALNSDLTNAAHSIGRGNHYTGAVKEYRRGAQLNRAMKWAAAAGAAEAARRTGVLGKAAHLGMNAAQ